MQQDTALDILKTGVNAFVTGEPGAGKTYTINRYIEWLREQGVEPAVTASTGIAATHIGGSTIHSYSGIGARGQIDEYGLDELTQKEQLVKRLQRTEVLILEEISMLDARLLDSVDQIFRTLRQSAEPFGGVQVILVGDFFQLPPVRPGETPAFAFRGESWRDAAPMILYLTEQWRQEDHTFLDLLSAMRHRAVKDEHISALSNRQVHSEHDIDAAVTKLYSHNADVDTINERELQKLESEPKVFEMETAGSKRLVEQLQKSCLSPEKLVLKEGAVVMFTKNNFEEGFVNGTIGVVKEFSSDGNPVVQTNDDRWIEVEPMDWTIEDQGTIKARLTQYPLRLAWAITVHKSQGMSLDAAVIDLSQAFEYGQGYVALSRVRSLDGLYLLGFNERALEVHPEVADADARFRKQAEALQQKYDQKTRDELDERQRGFLERMEAAGRSKRAHEETLDKLADAESIASLAKDRGVKVGTIIEHIEKLVTEEKVTPSEIRHLWDGDDSELTEIHSAFDEKGDERLSPVRKHLNNRYSFDALKLARALR